MAAQATGACTENTNRLLHLVNQLMDYRRAELGVFNLKVRPNPIHNVIKKTSCSTNVWQNVSR